MSATLWLTKDPRLSSYDDVSRYHRVRVCEIKNMRSCVCAQICLIKHYAFYGFKCYTNKQWKLAEVAFVSILKLMFDKGPRPAVPFRYRDCIKFDVLDATYHLGLLYLEKKEEDNHLVKAAALFQFCVDLGRLYGMPTHFYKLKSYQCEMAFGYVAIGLKDDLPRQLVDYRRQIVDEVRTWKSFTTPVIRNMYQRNQKFMIDYFIPSMFQACLGREESSVFSLLALGSYATSVATPWSDFEFMILLESEKDKETFLRVVRLFWIRVINLGETNLRQLGLAVLNDFRTGAAEDDWFWAPINKYGFCLDGVNSKACKFPFGRRGYTAGRVPLCDFELIGTPKTIAKLQYNSGLVLTDTELLQSLRSPTFVCGSKKLFLEYQHEIQQQFVLDGQRLRSQISGILRSDLLRHGARRRRSAEINVKMHVFRMIDRVIHGLGDYFHVAKQNLYDILEELAATRISSKFAQTLKEALTIALGARMWVYTQNSLNNKCNKDIIYLHPQHDGWIPKKLCYLADIMVEVERATYSALSHPISLSDEH